MGTPPIREDIKLGFNVLDKELCRTGLDNDTFKLLQEACGDIISLFVRGSNSGLKVREVALEGLSLVSAICNIFYSEESGRDALKVIRVTRRIKEYYNAGGRKKLLASKAYWRLWNVIDNRKEPELLWELQKSGVYPAVWSGERLVDGNYPAPL